MNRMRKILKAGKMMGEQEYCNPKEHSVHYDVFVVWGCWAKRLGRLGPKTKKPGTFCNCFAGFAKIGKDFPGGAAQVPTRHNPLVLKWDSNRSETHILKNRLPKIDKCGCLQIDTLISKNRGKQHREEQH